MLAFVRRNVRGVGDWPPLAAMVSDLADSLGVAGAFVNRLVPGRPQYLETVASHGMQHFEKPCLSLGTPDGAAIDASYLCIERNARSSYPTDKRLAALGAEGFAGLRLNTGSGEAVGVIAIADRYPLRDTDRVEAMLRIARPLAEAWLERPGTVSQPEKQRTEAKLAEAVESLSDAFALFDPDDRLVFCNRMFRELNPELARIIRPGITFEDMLQDNLTHGRILEAVGREEAYAAERMERHRNPGDPLLSERSDGHWLLLREMRAPDGSTFLVNSDLTELKKREDALRDAKERAEQANRAKSQFLATMSHELRTPLNAILGFSEILKNQLFGEIGDRRYRDYAEDIYSSGQHLLDLINDILDLSRIEAGRYELNLEEADIAAVIRSSCDVMREQARGKGVRFRTRIPTAMAPVRADVRALRQILLNLLSNAVKFTPASGSVTVTARQGRDGQVAVTVADTGIGIDTNDIDDLLRPFSTRASGDLETVGGAGLGLSIVRALVEMHGGTLTIDSAVGSGTRVTVRLRPAGRPG